MAWFNAMNVSLSSLEASRSRMEAASSNLANADSSAPADGFVYKLRRISLHENTSEEGGGPLGAHLLGVTQEFHEIDQPARMVYDPTHPDADPKGMVRYPEVDIITEMSELIHSRRAYDAGLTAYNESRSMFLKSLEIGKA